MKSTKQPVMKIVVTLNGPYLVSGGVPISEQWIVTNEQGESLEYRQGARHIAQSDYALCRCGHSRNKPFCDGTHKTIQFDGTETASRLPYLEQAEAIGGPTMLLTDAEPLCAFARFCDRKGGVWNLVLQTEDSQARQLVKHEAGHCPSGRLVAWERKTEQPFEPQFEPSIGLIEDTAKEVSGPIWVRGGIPVIAADGSTYEIRNRVTLCRCGRSANKPYCDGSHAA